jgi:hypothetical protein
MAMPDLSFIRAEIERMRVQIRRQQKDILALPSPAAIGDPDPFGGRAVGQDAQHRRRFVRSTRPVARQGATGKGMKSECLMGQQAIADIRHKS